MRWRRCGRSELYCSMRSVVNQTIRLFLVLAVAGAAAMFCVHVAALAGFIAPLKHSERILVYGMCAVFAAACLAGPRLSSGFKQKDAWRAMLRGCPRWMQRAVWIVFYYGWCGCFVYAFLVPGRLNSDR